MRLRKHEAFLLAGMMVQRRREHLHLSCEVGSTGVGAWDEGELIIDCAVLGLRDRQQWSDLFNGRVEEFVLDPYGVLLERASDVLVSIQEVPTPSAPDRIIALTVLDVGWEIGQILTTPAWVVEQVRSADRPG